LHDDYNLEEESRLKKTELESIKKYERRTAEKNYNEPEG